MTDSIASLFEQAVARHQHGDLVHAERGYQSVLSAQPRHAQALHLLGIIALQSRRAAEASDLISRSLAIDPDEPVAHLNLGSAQLQAGLAPLALCSFERAIHIAPDYADAWNNHGHVLLGLHRPQEALTSLDRALLLRAKFPLALNNRGIALRNLKCLQQAFESFDQACRLEPKYAAALYNRGSALLELKRYDEALSAYESMLQVIPDDAEALINCAIALLHLKRFDEALLYCQRAQATSPKSAFICSNHGNILLELRRYGEALECFARALQCDPQYADALNNHGNCLSELKRFAEARQSFSRLLQVSPGYPYALGALVHSQLDGCDWGHLTERTQQLQQRLQESERATVPFPFLAISDSPERQLQCARIFVEDKYPANTDGLKAAVHGHRHQKIRVAYLSGDFREHAVSSLIVGVLERHDRERFETVGISLRPEDPSALGQRIKAAFDLFADVSRRSDRDVVRWMRERQIDIAVDLNGFTHGLRLGILAQRAAPVQISYLGYPGTSGAPYIDYLIADSSVIPPGEERWYSERIVRLPHCYLPTDDRRQIATPALRRCDVGLPQTGFVFCGFASSYKIGPAMFEVWMRLLHAVPDSVLWLRDGTLEVTRNLRAEAVRRGIAAPRLVFATHVEDMALHLARHQLADLFLDTLPYNAHSTACDALWAGVPVLTSQGTTMAARAGASVLRALGVPELVTHDLSQYEQLALQLAKSPDTLNGIRARIAARRDSSPLFRTESFCRQLEAAYRHVWMRAEHGLEPEDYQVP